MTNIVTEYVPGLVQVQVYQGPWHLSPGGHDPAICGYDPDRPARYHWAASAPLGIEIVAEARCADCLAIAPSGVWGAA